MKDETTHVHYKGGRYKLICFATDANHDTGEAMAIYQHTGPHEPGNPHGTVWYRPRKEFVSDLEIPGSDSKPRVVKRFAHVRSFEGMIDIPKRPAQGKIDFVMMCLSEECHEIGKEAMKGGRFGVDSPRPMDHPVTTTRQMIATEVGDLLGVLDYLADMGYPLDEAEIRRARFLKKQVLTAQIGEPSS